MTAFFLLPSLVPGCLRRRIPSLNLGLGSQLYHLGRNGGRTICLYCDGGISWEVWVGRTNQVTVASFSASVRLLGLVTATLLAGVALSNFSAAVFGRTTSEAGRLFVVPSA